MEKMGGVDGYEDVKACRRRVSWWEGVPHEEMQHPFPGSIHMFSVGVFRLKPVSKSH